ncbi:MAG: cobaltochelatase subunit CobN, partial [Devosia sp.]
MHLLTAQAGALQQEGEAIDLGQTPGEIVFASAADSELTLIAGAVDRAGERGVRLANLLRLTHNLSVDLWIEKTAGHAKLVVVRLLGGPAYWPYGIEQLAALAADGRFKLALLPGDATPDPILDSRSTIEPAHLRRFHALFTAGGPDNADTTLATLRAIVAGATSAPHDGSETSSTSPKPFPRFGFWTPDSGVVFEMPARERPAVPLLFYRAALEGAGTATLAALYGEIERQGLAPVPLMISTLKEGACVRFVKAAFATHRPQAILNLTGFALGLDGLEDKLNPFAGIDAPVIQLVQGGRPETQWAADSQGLSAKDLAMQVVLPELDGRIGGIIVGHKAEAVWHAATECPLSAYAPDNDGIRRAVALANNYVRLRKTPRVTRKVAIVLANYPIRDGRLANGVGYDAPQSTVEILRHLGVDAPTDGNALIDLLQAGPTNAHPERGESVPFSLARYRELFAALPEEVQRDVAGRWGEPEADPFVREEAAFHLPVLLFGNVAVMLQPARGYDRDEAAAYHDPDLAPPHAYIAAYLWLRHEFGAHAILHNGKHGSLEWLPGKAVALDGASYPAMLWGELPHLYPFIVNDPGE